MNNEIEDNAFLVTPDTLGIIWITRENLSERPKYFAWMDYLFDGILNSGARGIDPWKPYCFP